MGHAAAASVAAAVHLLSSFLRVAVVVHRLGQTQKVLALVQFRKRSISTIADAVGSIHIMLTNAAP